MKIDQETGELYQRILSELTPIDGSATSSAALLDAIDEDSSAIGDAISDLLRFGELEFVNTSGSNMHVRVRPHCQTPKSKTQVTLKEMSNDSVWKAYVVSEYDETSIKAQRLFHQREEAIKHLAIVAGSEDLTPVPGLDDVWYEYSEYESEYAILRREPIFEHADDPWP